MEAGKCWKWCQIGEERWSGRLSPAAGGAARHGARGALVTACVTAVFDVGEADIALGSRGPARVALARQVAMYLHHVILGRTLTDIAVDFGRDRTTVAHACRLVEDRRDEPEFDATVSELEAALQDGLALIAKARRVA